MSWAYIVLECASSFDVWEEVTLGYRMIHDKKNFELNRLVASIQAFEKQLADLFAMLRANGNRALLQSTTDSDKSSYTSQQEAILQRIDSCFRQYDTLRTAFETHFPGQMAILEADALRNVTALYPQAYHATLNQIAVDVDLDKRQALALKHETSANERLIKSTAMTAGISVCLSTITLYILMVAFIASSPAVVAVGATFGALLVGLPLLMGITCLAGKMINHHIASKPRKEHDAEVEKVTRSWDKTPVDTAKIGFFHCKQLMAQKDMLTLEPRAKAFASSAA